MSDPNAPVHLRDRTTITARELSQFGPAVQTQYLLVGPEGRIDKVIVGTNGKDLYEHAALRKDKVKPDKVYEVKPLPVAVRPDVAPALPLAKKTEQTEPVPPPAASFTVNPGFLDWTLQQIVEAGITEDLDADMARAEILSDVLGIKFPYLGKSVPFSKEALAEKFRARLSYYLAERNASPDAEPDFEEDEPTMEVSVPMPNPQPAPDRLTGDTSPVVVLFDFQVTIDGQPVTFKMTNRGGTAQEIAAAITASVEGYRLARAAFPQDTPQFAPVSAPSANPLGARPATISAPKAPPAQTPQQWAAQVPGDSVQFDDWKSAAAKEPGVPIIQAATNIRINHTNGKYSVELFENPKLEHAFITLKNRDVETFVHWCATHDVNFAALAEHLGERQPIPRVIVTWEKGDKYGETSDGKPKYYRDLKALQ